MRRRRSLALFSFSFLDVFACTLGALIFILVGCVLEGQRVTRMAEEAMAEDVERERAEIDALRVQLEEGESEDGWRRDAVRQSIDQRRKALTRAQESKQAAEARLDALAASKADLAWTWGRLPTKVGDRVPIYLECKDGRVTWQPRGLVEGQRELTAEGSKIRALLVGLKDDPRRYPVLILRSTGFGIYQRVEQLCDSVGVDFAREPLPDDTRITGWK